ncbi:phosphoenolpyruvate carboxykinase (ATP), partial [Enterobacter sp. R1(2018)]|uniref:phosphoenolpyruvate carboxykinase (ATP) n=1 Tax=Enterobacter sp. R1(2018) TaxID=2447891 RepID=UPI00217DB941
LAGTERGVTSPQPTFSACFGAAFLSLHPTFYADILLKRARQAKAESWLVNTGWNGRGERFSLKDTRRIIQAILGDELKETTVTLLPLFGLAMPAHIDGIEDSLLDPRSSWESVERWENRAKDLASRFQANFVRFADSETGRKLQQAGPVVTGP